MLDVLLRSAADPAVHAALLIAFVAGLVRGFSGFGAGLVYVPMAAALFGPKVAAATILIFDIPASLPMTIRLWPKADRREVFPLALGAMAATPIGALLLDHLDPIATRWVVCALVAAGLTAIATGLRFSPEVGRPTMVGVGALSGFMNGLAQVGGPPLILFWLSRDKPAATVRASALLFFTVGTAATLAIYIASGFVTTEVLVLCLLLAPVFAAGMTIGGRLFGRASERVYRRIAYGIIAASVLIGLPLWR